MVKYLIKNNYNFMFLILMQIIANCFLIISLQLNYTQACGMSMHQGNKKGCPVVKVTKECNYSIFKNFKWYEKF